MMTFDQSLAAQSELESKVSAANKALNSFPKTSWGLTPDSVKQEPEWIAARRAFRAAFDNLRDFNAVFVKQFSKELAEARALRSPGAALARKPPGC